MQFGYDPAGHIVSLTDGRNHTKRWAYDIYGRQIAETNANSVLVKTNGYDANSRLIAQWTAAKGLTHLGYDNNGNVLSVQYPHSTISYTYDSLDRLWTISDGVGNSSFAYANFGAFQSALASEIGPWATVSYGYSGLNLTTSASAHGWRALPRMPPFGRGRSLRTAARSPTLLTAQAGSWRLCRCPAARPRLATMRSAS